MKIDLAKAAQNNTRRRAYLEQQTASFVAHFKADNGNGATVLRAVMADWDKHGACDALNKYPKEVHDWIRSLAGWAIMAISLEAMEHLVEDEAAESEATT